MSPREKAPGPPAAARVPRAPQSGAMSAAVPGTRIDPAAGDRLGGRLQRLLAWCPTSTAARRSAGRHRDRVRLSERQLVDDLNLLWCVELRNPDPFCPIDLSYEGGEIVVSQAESIGRPLRLAVDEASALLVALRMLADIPGLEDRSALSRLIAKLEAAAGEAAGPSAQVAVQVDKPTGDQAIVQIRDALERKRRVHLRYYVPGRDEATQRDVGPDAAACRRGPGLPGGLVPPRRGRPAVPAGPHPRHRRARCPGRGAAGGAAGRRRSGPVPAVGRRRARHDRGLGGQAAG